MRIEEAMETLDGQAESVIRSVCSKGELAIMLRTNGDKVKIIGPAMDAESAEQIIYALRRAYGAD